MKKIFHKIGLAIASLLAFSACSQVDYDGEYSKDGYFSGDSKVAFAFTSLDDTAQHYSFGLKALDTLTHTGVFRVYLAGDIVQRDRVFKVVADGTSTAQAGVHYTALPDTFLLPAGSSKAYVPIELIRANIQSSGLDTLTLVLRLISTDDLKANIAQSTKNGDYDKFYVYRNKVTITFDNTASAPDYWDFFEANFGLLPFTLQRYLKLQELLDNKLDEVVAKVNTGDFDAMMKMYTAIQEANKY